LDTISKWREDLVKELAEKARKEADKVDDKDKAKEDGNRGKGEFFDHADEKGRIKWLVTRINGRDTRYRMDSCRWCFSIGCFVTNCFIVDVGIKDYRSHEVTQFIEVEGFKGCYGSLDFIGLLLLADCGGCLFFLAFTLCFCTSSCTSV
jgi:hypothetical protein